jgi:sulfatase modifying factor 1
MIQISVVCSSDYLPETEAQETKGSCACTPGRENAMMEEIVSPNLDSIIDSNIVDVNSIHSSTLESGNTASIDEHLILIPSKEFWMGTRDTKIKMDGEDRRRVVVDSFYIDKYEVSNSDFLVFIRDTGYVTDSEKYGWSFVFHSLISKETMQGLTQAVLNAEWWIPVPNSSWLYPEGPGTHVFETQRSKHPVVHISWNDADAFCKWRNGSRLPTEAEWELAAGGGRDSVLYPWGNKILPNGIHRANIYQGSFPNYNSKRDGYEFLAPVDAFPEQNEFGVHNIIGNAWEWVSDWWTIDHNTTDVLHNPKGPNVATERTKKGGSFLCDISYCFRYRVAARYHSTPDSATSNSGVRCAKDI